MKRTIFTVKMTVEHYKEKGAERVAVCIGDPLTGYISHEVDISLEKLYDIEIEYYQAAIKNDQDNVPVLVITLIPPQIKKLFPNYRSHLKKTYFESDKYKEYTMFDSTKTAINNPPVAFCHYSKHPGYMTRKMMEQHSCLCKNGQTCPYLEKFLTHMYWTQKELKKNKSKTSKKY